MTNVSNNKVYFTDINLLTTIQIEVIKQFQSS